MQNIGSNADMRELDRLEKGGFLSEKWNILFASYKTYIVFTSSAVTNIADL